MRRPLRAFSEGHVDIKQVHGYVADANVDMYSARTSIDEGRRLADWA